MKDYSELVRRSIRRDFAKANFKRNGRVPKTPHPKDTKRVIDVDETSMYAKYRRYIVGRLVRICSNYIVGYGYWVQFVHDSDRKDLNSAAGWSNNKREYLLDGAKFDD